MKFKKSISIILSALGLTASAVKAATFGNFVYTDKGTTITITGYLQNAPAVVSIPPTIVGKPVTALGDYAFSDRPEITSVTIPSSVRRIGFSTFDRCSGLTNVTLPSSLISIGTQAFEVCTGLISVEFPANVTSIGDGAFQQCTGLTSVTIPSGVTDLKNTAFTFCHNLETITVDAANPAYASVNGVLYDKAETILMLCPAGRKSNFTIPASVTSIEAAACLFCTGLTSMIIPAGVTEIGFSAFARCAGLTSVTLSTGTAAIAISTFAGCASLTSVTIPSSVTRIADTAFAECTSLTSATFLGNAPTMGGKVFYQHPKGFTIYYTGGRTGYTTPLWDGHPIVAISAAPDIQVQQPVGTSLVDGTSKKTFGTVVIGVTSTAKTFTVTNTGLSDLKGLAITLDGSNGTDFNLTPMGKTTLPPGGKASFKVSFTPTATGTRRAAVHITSNDADEAPFDIQLGGMGVAPNPG